MDNMYMVLPDHIDNLESLEQWKNQFDQLTYDQRKISNDLSIQKYGLDNRKRYNAMKAKFNDSGCNNCNSNDETENTITSNIVSDNDDQLTHEDTVIVQSNDNDLYYHNDWSLKLSKAIAAEKEGLIIMIDTESDKFMDEYDQDMINRLKDKWEQLQSLSQNQRNLSNTTALSIFGIDNYNLYTKILNAYSSIKDTNSSVDISDLVSPNPEIQSESSIVPYFTSEEIKNMNIKYSDHSYLRNISEDCTIEEFMNFYHTHGTLSDQYMYANTLEKLYIELENARDQDTKNSIKQSILELGWNPEIHFSREISKKCNIRHSLDDLRIKSLKESNNIGAFYYSMNQKYNKDEDIIIMAQEILSSK